MFHRDHNASQKSFYSAPRPIRPLQAAIVALGGTGRCMSERAVPWGWGPGVAVSLGAFRSPGQRLKRWRRGRSPPPAAFHLVLTLRRELDAAPLADGSPLALSRLRSSPDKEGRFIGKDECLFLSFFFPLFPDNAVGQAFLSKNPKG